MKRRKFLNYEEMEFRRAEYIQHGYKVESYANPKTGEYWIEIKVVPTEVVWAKVEKA